MGVIIWDGDPNSTRMTRSRRRGDIRIRGPRIPAQEGVPGRERPDPAADDPHPDKYRNHRRNTENAEAQK